MRIIHCEDLPKRTNGNTDWVKCIGIKVPFIYDDIEGFVEIIKYDGKKLGIKYKNNNINYITTSKFRECKIGVFVGAISRYTPYFIGEEVNGVIITNCGFKKDNRESKIRAYKYKCPKCLFNCSEHYKDGNLRHELWISNSDLRAGHGCSCCCKNPKIISTNINSMYHTDHWMVDLGIDEEFAKTHSKSSGKKAPVKCPDCGKSYTINICNVYNKKSIGCICGDGFSYGHKYVYSVLKQLRLEPVGNKRFDWCTFRSYGNENKLVYGEYDLAIPDMSLIIEVDGGWHRVDNKMSGQTKEHSKYLDDMKDLRAKENGYKVIRIDSTKDIKDEILNSELSIFFDLSDTDWDRASKFAMSNISKKACDIYNSNKSITSSDIAIKLNVSNITVMGWIKKWSDRGLCTYDNSRCNRIKDVNKIKKGNLVEAFKDNISLGVFKSYSELSRKSFGLFGIHVSRSSISAICLGNQESLRNGLTFRKTL